MYNQIAHSIPFLIPELFNHDLFSLLIINISLPNYS
jgi:hypothetical protein